MKGMTHTHVRSTADIAPVAAGLTLDESGQLLTMRTTTGGPNRC